MLRFAIKLGRAFGIGIYVHWSFFLLPALVLFLNLQQEQPAHPLFLLAVLAAVFGCVVLHELGHALTARYFGIGTRDITLYPIGGVARLERMSEKPWEEFWIAVGGPAVNVAIATLLLMATLWLSLWVPPAALLHSTAGSFLLHLLALNVVLVLFNLLPAFPMDGGRVFRALLALWLDRVTATRVAFFVGLPIVVLLALVSLLPGQQISLLPFVMMFVVFAGLQELRYVEWKHRRAEEPLPVIPVRKPVVILPSFAPTDAAAEPFVLKPKISVYVWDSRTGMWVKETGV